METVFFADGLELQVTGKVSGSQQLAGAIIFLLTATIVTVNFVTDIALALIDPRIRKSVVGG